jgi:glutamate 5-kinase
VVGILSPEGKLIARGLTNYASAEATKVAGKKSAEIRSLLGDAAYDEVVHRDNMVIL